MTGRLRLSALLALVLAFAICASAATPDQLVDNGRFKQARTLLEQQLRANPNDAHLNWLAARVHRAFGDLPGAIGLAQKAVQLAPGNADYHLTLAELQGRQAQQSSLVRQALMARGIYKELQTAYQLDPKNVDAKWGMLRYYWMAPGIAGGDKNKARAMAAEIARLDPVQGYFAQAVLAEEEKRTADIESNYRKSIEVDPKNFDARMNLAEFYMVDPRNFDKAEPNLLAAEKIAPGRIEPYAELAKIYAERQQWQKLDEVLIRSEHQIGDNLLPYYNAGATIANAGSDLGRAERYFRKYISQEPEGNSPSISMAHWRLGQVLDKLGRRPEAITELDTAVKMNPGLDGARKDLKRIRG
jgi:tetratricopeptide (TPR) repeat protein